MPFFRLCPPRGSIGPRACRGAGGRVPVHLEGPIMDERGQIDFPSILGLKLWTRTEPTALRRSSMSARPIFFRNYCGIVAGRLSSVNNFYIFAGKTRCLMYWTLELASSLDDAPWPASKEELIDYANRSGAPEEVIENLEELEEEGEVYESIEDIWPDYPTKDDFFFNEEEY